MKVLSHRGERLWGLATLTRAGEVRCFCFWFCFTKWDIATTAALPSQLQASLLWKTDLQPKTIKGAHAVLSRWQLQHCVEALPVSKVRMLYLSYTFILFLYIRFAWPAQFQQGLINFADDIAPADEGGA